VTGSFRGVYRDANRARVHMPWCRYRRDAEEQLQAALEEVATENMLPVGGLTLRAWGVQYLDRRELEGGRAAQKDRSVWKRVLLADFIDWPIRAITRRDVKRWMGVLNQQLTRGRGDQKQNKKRKKKNDKRPLHKLSWQTRTHALNLLRRAIAVALDDELLGDDYVNPCIDLAFKKEATTEVATNFLRRDEIAAVASAAPPHIKPLMGANPSLLARTIAFRVHAASFLLTAS
jgi:hypothetical protein